jgi:hypothetical protein
MNRAALIGTKSAKKVSDSIQILNSNSLVKINSQRSVKQAKAKRNKQN